jgi:Tol biopolymer transport system component
LTISFTFDGLAGIVEVEVVHLHRRSVLLGLSAVLLLSSDLSAKGSSTETNVSGTVTYSLSIPTGHGARIGWIETATLAAGGSKAITSRAASLRRIDNSAELSPDGLMIAFARSSRSPSARGIFIVSSAGGRAYKIATVDAKNARAVYPLRWSPRGDRLVFDRHGAVECNTKKPFDLRFDVSRADGHGTTTIHALPRPDTLVELGDIRWSPDGTKLLYFVYALDNAGSDPNECRFHRPASTLYAVNADGSGRTRLVVDREVHAATWSPDGTQIAYVDCYDADVAGCDLYNTPADGSGGGRLLQAGEIQPAADLAWSPRGDEILDTGYSGLYAFDLAKKTDRTVLKWPESDSTATVLDFSATGESVALISSYGFGRDYYTNRVTIQVAPLYGGSPTSILVPAKGGRGRLGNVSVWLP